MPSSSNDAAVRRSGRGAKVVQARVQNAIAVAAVMAAIMMLGLTLVAPHRSLVVTDAPAAYADAS
jgi:hypothetical protein